MRQIRHVSQNATNLLQACRSFLIPEDCEHRALRASLGLLASIWTFSKSHLSFLWQRAVWFPDGLFLRGDRELPVRRSLGLDVQRLMQHVPWFVKLCFSERKSVQHEDYQLNKKSHEIYDMAFYPFINLINCDKFARSSYGANC